MMKTLLLILALSVSAFAQSGFFADEDSKLYWSVECGEIYKIEKRLGFRTHQQAEEAGYKKADSCTPHVAETIMIAPSGIKPASASGRKKASNEVTNMLELINPGGASARTHVINKTVCLSNRYYGDYYQRDDTFVSFDFGHGVYLYMARDKYKGLIRRFEIEQDCVTARFTFQIATEIFNADFQYGRLFVGELKNIEPQETS